MAKPKTGLAAERIERDLLYKILCDGEATPDDQKRAATWLKWMAQFVPDKRYEARLKGKEE